MKTLARLALGAAVAVSAPAAPGHELAPDARLARYEASGVFGVTPDQVRALRALVSLHTARPRRAFE